MATSLPTLTDDARYLWRVADSHDIIRAADLVGVFNDPRLHTTMSLRTALGHLGYDDVDAVLDALSEDGPTDSERLWERLQDEAFTDAHVVSRNATTIVLRIDDTDDSSGYVFVYYDADRDEVMVRDAGAETVMADPTLDALVAAIMDDRAANTVEGE